MMGETLTYCNVLVAQIQKELASLNESSDAVKGVRVLERVQRKARNLGRICSEVKLALRGVVEASSSPEPLSVTISGTGGAPESRAAKERSDGAGEAHP